MLEGPEDIILEKSIDVMHNAAPFECMCSNDADQVFSVLNLGTVSDWHTCLMRI